LFFIQEKLIALKEIKEMHSYADDKITCEKKFASRWVFLPGKEEIKF